MVMRAIIEEADVETSKSMQTLALTEGAFLTHLHMALLAQGKDLRVLTNKQLSGHLIGLWLADNQPANDLMTRCLVCISRNNGLGNFSTKYCYEKGSNVFIREARNIEAEVVYCLLKRTMQNDIRISIFTKVNILLPQKWRNNSENDLQISNF